MKRIVILVLCANFMHPMEQANQKTNLEQAPEQNAQPQTAAARTITPQQQVVSPADMYAQAHNALAISMHCIVQTQQSTIVGTYANFERTNTQLASLAAHIQRTNDQLLLLARNTQIALDEANKKIATLSAKIEASQKSEEIYRAVINHLSQQNSGSTNAAAQTSSKPN
jgi:hypothetical protein